MPGAERVSPVNPTNVDEIKENQQVEQKENHHDLAHERHRHDVDQEVAITATDRPIRRSSQYIQIVPCRMEADDTRSTDGLDALQLSRSLGPESPPERGG